MTQEEIFNGNKCIAEFMGYEFTETPDCGILGGNKFTRLPKEPKEPPFVVYHGWCPPKYNTSWDWLMSVVDKISKICLLDKELYNEYFWGKIVKTDFLIFRVNTVEELWKMVVEFVEWYNENKKS
jgi:hypothetical protein